jgi:hypothetical protein
MGQSATPIFMTSMEEVAWIADAGRCYCARHFFKNTEITRGEGISHSDCPSADPIVDAVYEGGQTKHPRGKPD